MTEPGQGGSLPDVAVLQGDCRAVMPSLADDSVDAVVTDPPYELAFMGKHWDASGVSFDPDTWRECLRVLKPGGHLVAFGGSRTWHRLAVAIEDAGFEIRDSIAWLYGSGFPKSVDVAKAIDKQAGHWRGRAGAVESRNPAMSGSNYARTPKGEPVTEDAQAWEGWGTGLKPAFEPIIIARKPFRGTVADNVLEHGTGAINIDASRVGDEVRVDPPGATNPRTAMGDGRRDDAEPRVVVGRWPTNVALDGGQAEALDAETGGAARFFPVFKYQSKAPKRERPEVDGVKHSTVKPLGLMRWLVRLVTPPGGVVLDPFAGSGTTLEAASLEGFDAVGIEASPEYLPLIEQRLGVA